MQQKGGERRRKGRGESKRAEGHMLEPQQAKGLFLALHSGAVECRGGFYGMPEIEPRAAASEASALSAVLSLQPQEPGSYRKHHIVPKPCSERDQAQTFQVLRGMCKTQRRKKKNSPSQGRSSKNPNTCLASRSSVVNIRHHMVPEHWARAVPPSTTDVNPTYTCPLLHKSDDNAVSLDNRWTLAHTGISIRFLPGKLELQNCCGN